MFDFVRTYFQAVREREEGQALVEYALILATISVISVTTLQLLGQDVLGALNSVVAGF